MMLFMIQKEIALSFAIVAHAFDFFPNVISGLLTFLFSEGDFSYNKELNRL